MKTEFAAHSMERRKAKNELAKIYKSMSKLRDTEKGFIAEPTEKGKLKKNSD